MPQSFPTHLQHTQGITSIRSPQCGANVRATLARLWAHEHARVYGDRLVDAADARWLEGLLVDVMRSKLEWRGAAGELFGAEGGVLFGE